MSILKPHEGDVYQNGKELQARKSLFCSKRVFAHFRRNAGDETEGVFLAERLL